MRAAAVALVLVAVLAAPAHAGERLRIDAADTSRYPHVTVTVTAPAAGDLKAGAFRVREGGDHVRDVRVTPLGGRQLEVVLVVDTSGSMEGSAIAEARRAAGDFVERMPSAVRIAVVGFGTKPALLSRFEASRREHLDVLSGLRARGETALYDAVVEAATLFDEDDRRRVIVLLSDGGDTVSDASAARAEAAVATAGAVVHAVQLVTSESDRAALGSLARPGRVVPATDPDALRDVYDGIAQELVSQYSLSWRSEAHGRTHVEIAARSENGRAAAATFLALPALPLARPSSPSPSPSPASVDRADGTVVEAPGPLTERWALYLAAALLFSGLWLLLLLVLAVDRRRRRLQPRSGAAPGGLQRGLSELTGHAVLLAERGLQRRRLGVIVNRALERAGVNLRPAEFLVLAASAVMTAVALGSMLGNLLLGLGLGALTVGGVPVLLRHQAGRRRGRFADQLNDTLQLLAGSLRAGYGLMQAIDAVSREADPPTSDEFRRVVVETRLGRDFADALRAMADRVGNVDFEWVVQAVEIHREVGGDLAEVLDSVSQTVRERDQIRRQIKVLSAEGRLSGLILCLVPPSVAALISVVSPGYLQPLASTTPGRVAVAVAALLMGAGVAWMRKAVRLVF